MKQLSTKTLESLLVVTARTAKGVGATQMKHLERALRRHDRRGELRASLLGVEPTELRQLLKRHTFEEIIRKYGYKERQDFYLALMGKLRSELLYRGWTRSRIDGSISNKVALAT